MPYAWRGVDGTGAVAIGSGTIQVSGGDTKLKAAMDAYGVCIVWQNSDYADIDAVFAELVTLGVRLIRGRYQNGARGKKVMSLCDQHNIRWIASIVSESFAETTDGKANGPAKFTRAEVRTKTRTWAREALAHPAAKRVLWALEGGNEWNSVRGGGQPISDWPERATDVNVILMEERDAAGFTAATLPVTSPSMHTDDDTADGGGGDWRKVAAAGCPADILSIHSYPFGQEVLNRLDARIANAHSAYPGLKVILSEHGWVVSPPCVPVSGKPQLVTPAQQAEFVSAAPLQLYRHPDVVAGCLFELRDSITGGTDVQDCRGVIRGTTWRPAGIALQGMYAATV